MKAASFDSSSRPALRSPEHTSTPKGRTAWIASATFSEFNPPAKKTGTRTASTTRRLTDQSWTRPVPPSSFTANGGRAMPVVTVRITRDGTTADQKREIVAEITATLQRVLGKKPEHTHVIIEEIDPENWGFAGMLTTEYRRQQT